MDISKYNVNQYSVGSLLNFIKNGEIAIPEIQRPFVWRKSQVRDLIDSLFNGYPIGYLIIWKNPDIKLKDGTLSNGKKILIDGQQRVTALMTAIGGIEVVNAKYKKDRVKIAFNPYKALGMDPDGDLFQVQDPSHLKSKKYIADIADIFSPSFNSWDFIKQYCNENPDILPEKFNKVIQSLLNIQNAPVGVIDLDSSLGIDVVTDIFIRINSQGTALSQGDFVMSKIAADESHGGNMLRKAIDYYSHMATTPSFYDTVINDEEFAKSDYFPIVKWLKEDNENVFNPDYNDIIRTAFMSSFKKAKLADLVAMLSGRDFKTREYKAEIIDTSYSALIGGVKKTMNEWNFKQFMVALRGAGFVSPKLINSHMAVDFAYALFLMLLEVDETNIAEIKPVIQRWYVLSVLTGRYTGSPESAFNADIARIQQKGIKGFLTELEEATFSDNYWNIQLPLDLDNSSPNNPAYLVYLAAQIKNNEKSLLSSNVTVNNLIMEMGDVHHIFPRAFLKSKGFDKSIYNQDGNYAYIDTQINIGINDREPAVYFKEAFNQCLTKKIVIGNITDIDQLKENLRVNSIPENILDFTSDTYQEFLSERRKLMAWKIRDYYYSF